MGHPREGRLLEHEVIPPPHSEAQLVFLSKLQRLFAEGDFTATYKFALLIALADLAVEVGKDDGDTLGIANRTLAEKFVELYWQQSIPYSAGRAGTSPGVLAQNNGTQAAIVKAIIEFRQRCTAASVQSARLLPGYRALIKRVAQTVSAQPVSYLQNLGGQTDPFLYVRTRGGILLKPGVAYCLRRFQPLVQQLARSHWIDHVKGNRLNLPLLGQADDLATFMFETSRQTLLAIGSGLRRITSGRCFYCGSKVHDADVDHFVPFSLYPRDLMHNFVLAHPSCNRSKSDALAARPHLERWLEYIDRNDVALQEIGNATGRTSDRLSTCAVARWAYAGAAAGNAMAWLSAKSYVPIDRHYLDCLA